jgi:nucleoside-diphosphate-sugar epimerase
LKSIFLTGSSGFVGASVLKYFGTNSIIKYKRGDQFKFDTASTIIHLAGKAHDLKKTSNKDKYYEDNTELTKCIYDAYLASDTKVFITLSSVKAVADHVNDELYEDHIANPITHYGKSKLLAEQYILSKGVPEGKKFYILRPCMIYGPGNKGNLNLLFKFVSKGIPWPLGAYENKRSFCSVDNLMFIIKELIERDDIPSGIYNVADDIPLSTNEIISILAKSQNRNPKIWKVSKILIQFIAKIGNLFKLPLNEDRLEKLTNSYIVSNKKIKIAIAKPLPESSRDGLFKTFKSFNK